MDELEQLAAALARMEGTDRDRLGTGFESADNDTDMSFLTPAFYQLESTINPDIGTGDSTVTKDGTIDTPDTTIPEQPSSDTTASPLLPDENTFRSGFDDLGSDDDNDGQITPTDDPTPVTPVDAPIADTTMHALRNEHDRMSKCLYQYNLVQTMISLIEQYKHDPMAVRATLAALDPNNYLTQMPEMAGCAGLYAPANVGIESAETGGILNGLRNLWEALKNKLFKPTSVLSLDSLGKTIPPLYKANDEIVATAASTLAAHYATGAISDEMIASAVCSLDYAVLSPKGVNAAATSLGALHTLAAKAVAEVLPSNTDGLKTYCENVCKILKPVLDTFGISRSMEGVVGRNIAYGSIAAEIKHIPTGATLSTAGYTTQKQIVDLAKTIGEKCQMSQTAALLVTFAENTERQIASIAGAATADAKIATDERIAVSKAAAMLTIALIDEAARQVVSDVMVNWIGIMKSVPKQSAPM